MADFKTLSGSRISFELEIAEADLKKFKKTVLERFRKGISVKGFRKGQAPDDVVRETIGVQRLSFEALNEAVDGTYRAFITKHKLSPVASPKIDLSDPQKMPIKIKVEIEVFPEVNLRNYQKIKIKALKIEISETEIDDVIETILADMNLGKKVDRAAQTKDFVEVDFVGNDKQG